MINAVAEKNALINVLKLPRDTVWSEKDGTLVGTWIKRGGHAGEKTLARVRERATELGYGVSSASSSGVPDGSHVGSRTVLETSDGRIRVELDRSYGATKDKNRFSIVVRRRLGA